jgi:hypothetical protein
MLGCIVDQANGRIDLSLPPDGTLKDASNLRVAIRRMARG